MIKFIHCADIHLDKSLGLADPSKAALRRQDKRAAFMQMITDAAEKAVDMVVISGGLFDRRNVSKQTVDFLAQAFASCPECKFIIAPGKSDYYTADSVYQLVDFPKNVYVFKSDAPSLYEFDIRGESVRVYGVAYVSSAIYSSPLEGFKADRAEGINILAMNCCCTESGGEFSPEPSALVQSGIDYCAFSDRGASAGIYDEGDMWYAYPGSLEYTGFDSFNAGGYVLVEAEKKNTDFICKPRLVSVSRKKHITEAVNVSGAMSAEDVVFAVKEKLDNRQDLDENTLLRIILTGDVLPDVRDFEDSILALANGKNVFYAELVDNTVPLYSYEYLSADQTIKGALFNTFRPAICSEDEKVRRQAISALRIGLDALDGKNVGTVN